MPWIHLHDHSLDGCIHTTIHVLLFEVFIDVYVSMLACRFSNDKLWFPASTYKAFHPSLYLGLHGLGGICYTTFCHCVCTPHSVILEDLYSEPYMLPLHEETPIVSLFMSRTIPFCTISPKSYVFPSLQDWR